MGKLITGGNMKKKYQEVTDKADLRELRELVPNYKGPIYHDNYASHQCIFQEDADRYTQNIKDKGYTVIESKLLNGCHMSLHTLYFIAGGLEHEIDPTYARLHLSGTTWDELVDDMKYATGYMED